MLNKEQEVFSKVADAVRNPNTDAVRGLSDYLIQLEKRVEELEDKNCYYRCANCNIPPVLTVSAFGTKDNE